MAKLEYWGEKESGGGKRKILTIYKETQEQPKRLSWQQKKNRKTKKAQRPKTTEKLNKPLLKYHKLPLQQQKEIERVNKDKEIIDHIDTDDCSSSKHSESEN
jgi:beta-N-acetylglucosaminidase